MITRIRRAAAILTLALLVPAGAGAQWFPATDDVETMLRYLVEDRETPGIVLGFLEGDGAPRIVSWGTGGAEARPLGPKSVFEIGSITKVFTGILLADMVDRGEVALDDPVSKYLPDGVTVPSRNGREITLLDLATHRSSLPRMPDNMEREGNEAYPEYTIEDLYEFLSDHELRRDIGSEYEYSNIAVALLGHVLERAAGAPYETLLRERILDPLGMDMTSTVVAGELAEWNTRGHEQSGEAAPYRNWPNLPAMGALRSNAEDLLKFLAANMGEPQSRLERVMRTAHEIRNTIGPGAEIGLLWSVRTAGNRRIIMHGGATAGYSTSIGFDPDMGVGMVMLTNTNEFGDDIGLDFLRRGPPLGLAEVEVPADVLAGYAGEYEVAPGRSMVMRQEPEGYLTMQAPGNVRFRMHAESDTKFFVKRTPWRFTFTKDDAGRVTGLVADLEGTERRARRIGDAGPPPAVLAGNQAAEQPLAVDEMAAYVGAYTLTYDGRSIDLRVFIEDGRLMGQPEGENPSRLLYQGEHTFIPAAEIDMRLVFAVEDGRAERLTVREGDNVMTGTRKQQER